eukprot:CAMPEP_0203744898 /NCGR_PEP_ID=MMETSP0098-20131031/811_1 /ASSEMBLY_ACC=CAM_ASM_000208 /TAXON_ID=96639 /ORGANISM=" , Strain NY0313808BC1" /LENGTH=461 /DNA_ID=CAMNT_0050632529 /DNA_START=273 /DNA_END=1655 /DNA_ORIENTATION=-
MELRMMKTWVKLILLGVVVTVCHGGVEDDLIVEDAEICNTKDCSSGTESVEPAFREGVDKSFTMDEFAEQLSGGGDVITDQAEPEIEEDNVEWDDITGNLTVVHPAPGSNMTGSATAVQLNVHTNCPNVTRFREKFNKSSICLSLDDAPFSCWPVFGLSKFPLYANLQPGIHSVVAKLVDPVTNKVLIDESMAESSFLMIEKNKTLEEELEEATRKAAEAKQKQDQDSEEVPEDDTKTETIAIPQVGIEQPAEEMVMPHTFEVRLHIVTAANLTQFRRLFQDSFICLALDNSISQSCWPIFEERYYPKFFNLKPGKHKLVASISHPNTLDIIDATSIGERNFWVSDDPNRMIPMTLSEPSKGSNAFDKNLQEQVMEEIRLNEDGTEATTESRNEAFVTLKVNVDNVRHLLKVYKSDDYVTLAARFCVEQNILGQNCVKGITDLIEEEWRKLSDLPHLELFS